MNARELMAAADHLSGVRPGMSHDQIRACLVSSTLELMWIRYLLDEYKKTRDSEKRASLLERMVGWAGENRHLKSLLEQELADRVSSTSIRASGRPRKHTSESARKREWAR